MSRLTFLYAALSAPRAFRSAGSVDQVRPGALQYWALLLALVNIALGAAVIARALLRG